MVIYFLVDCKHVSKLYIYAVLHQFENYIETQLPFLKEAKLLLAISGGIDSVVLAHLCKQVNLDFALAHCNFNLRGDESDADEDFVLDLAEDLDVEVFVEGFDTDKYAKINKLSTQMAARELRYSWFDDLCNQLGFDYVLTAHHADDNLETFLINLSRGTGLDGLTGIPEFNDYVVRPLLSFSRDDIEAYASENRLKWREDSSNASTKYLRNKYRHEVIPKLKEINPRFLDNFMVTQEHLTEAKTILEDRMDAVLEQVVDRISSVGIYFDVEKISQLSNPKAYLYQLLKNYGFTEWNDLVNLLDAQSGKQLFSETHRLIKDRDTIILTDLLTDVTSNEVAEYHIEPVEVRSRSTVKRFSIEKDQNQFKTPHGILFFDEADAIVKPDQNTIYVDKDLLKYPLTVRKWQEGDYFYPFGMTGKKKLSKFFKDEKLSLLDKEKIWLLCSNNDIVWVIGKRQDNRFKITNTTKHILKISIQ